MVWNSSGKNTFNANSSGEVSASKQYDLPATATNGGSCAPNGTVASSTDGSGKLMSCVNGTWTGVQSGGFSNSYQMAVSNGAMYQNTNPGPMFVATLCNQTPKSSGYTENVTLTVYNQSGAQTSQSNGQVQEGGSDANFNANPSTSAMIPPGYYFAVTGSNMSCSLMVAE
jgi:hypothetical protein